uniref:Venom protein n=1 Tax=Ampulex compressa TaxID=860918 RepID=A0A1W6EVQ1_AMPCP|nr:venom protein [Ampulex compressa]
MCFIIHFPVILFFCTMLLQVSLAQENLSSEERNCDQPLPKLCENIYRMVACFVPLSACHQYVMWRKLILEKSETIEDVHSMVNR